MNRITEIEVGTASVGILGDPHLGRSFVRGVPLEKRGFREKMVMEDFQHRMKVSGQYDAFICMGDLFDKWAVPYSVVFQAAWAYLQAAAKNPHTMYYVLGGNHDISRDLEKKGALDLFELIVSGRGTRNIEVVRHTNPDPRAEIGGVTCGLYAFHPTEKAETLIKPAEIAFGHWDTVFGEDNMIPTKKLAEMGCEVAYTGHVHLPDQFKRDGVDVIQVGSMQPYAHGEESDDQLYITFDCKRKLELTKLDLSNRCVRVLLTTGERLDEEVNCLQLTIKRLGTTDEEETDEVSLGDFDLMGLFAQAFADAGVPDDVRSQILTKYEEARVAE